MVLVTFWGANTTVSPTLNVNSTGAKKIISEGSSSIFWAANSMFLFVYDGTYWRLCNAPQYPMIQQIDLSSQSVDKWIPVVGTTIPSNININIGVEVQLNSGTVPSWSTHSSGFTVSFEVLIQRNGWGATNGTTFILRDEYKFCSSSPVSYGQMEKPSLPCLYLRGGGKYAVSTSYLCGWTVYPSGYTWTSGSYSQTVTPQTSRPTPEGNYIITNSSSRLSLLNSYIQSLGAKAGTFGPTASITDSSFGDTFSVPKITVNSYGHVSDAATYTIKMPTGGTFSKQLLASGFSGTSWSNSADGTKSVIEVPAVSGGYMPAVGMGSPSGHWTMGTLCDDSGSERLYFDYHSSDDSNWRQCCFDPRGSQAFIQIGGNGDCALRQTCSNSRSLSFGIGSSYNWGGIYDNNLGRWVIASQSGSNILWTQIKSGSSQYIPSGTVQFLTGYTSYLEVVSNGTAYGVDWWKSDKALKTNIQETEIRALDYIKKFSHVSFDWKEDGNHVPIGYIAQDLEEIIPDAVIALGEDKIRNILPSHIIPYLSKAIQELLEEIDNLKEQIQKLEA